MILLEEYYELQEAENVSRFWKSIQILCYVSAAVFGIWSGFTLGLLRTIFENKCFLFAKISKDDHNSSEEVRFAETEHLYEDWLWSPDTICEFCQYSMVSSFIFATIWGTFFLMCGAGGKSSNGLPQPWRITLPAMIFNFIYLLIAFAAALQIQFGTDVFCGKKLELRDQEPFGKCRVLNVYEKKRADSVLIQIEIATKTSWMTAISWFFAFLIPLLRIIFVADFNLFKVSVYRIDDLNNQNEEILRVVEYEGNQVYFKDRVRENPGRHMHDD